MSKAEPTPIEYLSLQCRKSLIPARRAIALFKQVVIQAQLLDLDSVPDETVIDNISDLNGSVAITAGELKAMIATQGQMKDLWDADLSRLLHAKFVGAENLDG